MNKFNQFIVWDKEKKTFVKDTEEINGDFYYLDREGRLCFFEGKDDRNIILDKNTYKYFNYIGKTDDTPEKNKIYADCSIVEFEIDDSVELVGEKVRGIFSYSKEYLSYRIRISRPDMWDEWISFGRADIKNFKVIGSLQMNKELLHEKL